MRIVGAYDALFAGREWSTYRILDIREVDGRPVDIELITRKGRGKLHLKTMSLDGETVITGSTNWSAAGAVRNDELMLVIRCGNFAAAYNLYFQKIYRKYTGRELPEGEESRGGNPEISAPKANYRVIQRHNRENTGEAAENGMETRTLKVTGAGSRRTQFKMADRAVNRSEQIR